jgi:hypothetical protein
MDVHKKDIAKLMLSAKELDVVNNIDWILTKHNITAKLIQHFALLSQQMVNIVGANIECLPNIILKHPPKIAKGENYLQLPYIMLDYPRVFYKNDAFAVRTFFWWGNHISMHLLLSGGYKQQYQAKILHQIPYLQQHQFFICVHQSEWQHHFNDDNYMSMQFMDSNTIIDIIKNKNFIKLAKKIPLLQWENVNDFFDTTCKQMLHVLCT